MSFNKAYKITISHEGGYSNHPSDRGGETFNGISRVFHPEWKGWIKLDKTDFKSMVDLDNEVKDFYKGKFWDILKLDEISKKISNSAIELFDISVNMGVRTAGKILQRSINILNREEHTYDNLIVDGLIGNKTISMIDKYLSTDTEAYLLKLILLLKAKHYIDIVEANESQEVFIRGWLNRIKF